MKISNAIITVLLVTVISLFYVYQQTEIFRLAYNGQKKSAVYQEILDKNTVLRYNIKQAESLIYIADRVCESEEFQMPDAYQVVKVSYPSVEPGVSSSNAGLRFVSQLFGIKREAEARTIRPSRSP